MADQERRLTRSRKHRVIAGICGGFAVYYGWQPWAVRFLYVLVPTLSAGFPGGLIYSLPWTFMPKEPRKKGVTTGID